MMRSVSESVPSARSTIIGMRTGIRGTTGEGVCVCVWVGVGVCVCKSHK